MEPYGYTLLNQSTPAFASTMAGVVCQIEPRLFLDSGVDFGITSAAPEKRAFVGVTYAIANVYSRLRPNRH